MKRFEIAINAKGDFILDGNMPIPEVIGCLQSILAQSDKQVAGPSDQAGKAETNGNRVQDTG